MTTHETEQMRSSRLDTINRLVANGADREHFESMTPEQFARFCATAILTNADKIREHHPDIAEKALRDARDITGHDGERRRVTLSDGRGVLVDGDCTHTDEEIRGAVGDMPECTCAKDRDPAT